MYVNVLFLAILDALKMRAFEEFVITRRASERIQILHWILHLQRVHDFVVEKVVWDRMVAQ